MPILDFGLKKRCCGKPELSRLLRENDDVPSEAILAEMGVKGKSMVESVMIDQSKARAVNKTKIFVVVSCENRLGSLFNRLANMKHSDSGLVKRSHEFGGVSVTDSGADQGIGLGEDKIGC